MPEVLLPLQVPEVVRGGPLEDKYQETAQKFLREQIVLRLYEDGEISTGTGAKMLGMCIYDFIQFLGRHQVSIFQFSEDELAAEAASERIRQEQKAVHLAGE
jgi:predicted HTH domain antitoxin